jgi:spore coat protein CotF
MTLTQKENLLLCDLKSQEQLCIDKYSKYEASAKDPCLKNLFSTIKTTEQNHLSTINRILGGEEVSMNSSSGQSSNNTQNTQCQPSSVSAEDKQSDAFLCKDALAMEKHVSSVYDTAIFEFKSQTLRDTLNHIQKEEQNHGKDIYSYMAVNGMYS